MLNRDEIEKLGLIVDGVANSRAASYDIRVGKIIAKDSNDNVAVKDGDFYTIPAQGMVEVISQERVKLPKDVAGYASIMTRLSRQGLLALNTGIIDPTYDGPLSAVMVNFGRAPFCLYRGEPFLRLTFHRYDPPEALEASRPIPSDSFLQERTKETTARFSRSFLDLERHFNESMRSVLWDSIPKLAPLIAGLGVAVAFITWGVTLGVSHWQGGFLSKDQVKETVGEYFQSDDFKRLSGSLATVRNEELDDRIRIAVEQALRAELAKHSQPTESRSPTGKSKSRAPGLKSE